MSFQFFCNRLDRCWVLFSSTGYVKTLSFLKLKGLIYEALLRFNLHQSPSDQVDDSVAKQRNLEKSHIQWLESNKSRPLGINKPSTHLFLLTDWLSWLWKIINTCQADWMLKKHFLSFKIRFLWSSERFIAGFELIKFRSVLSGVLFIAQRVGTPFHVVQERI